MSAAASARRRREWLRPRRGSVPSLPAEPASGWPREAPREEPPAAAVELPKPKGHLTEIIRTQISTGLTINGGKE